MLPPSFCSVGLNKHLYMFNLLSTCLCFLIRPFLHIFLYKHFGFFKHENPPSTAGASSWWLGRGSGTSLNAGKISVTPCWCLRQFCSELFAWAFLTLEHFPPELIFCPPHSESIVCPRCVASSLIPLDFNLPPFVFKVAHFFPMCSPSFHLCGCCFPTLCHQQISLPHLLFVPRSLIKVVNKISLLTIP